MSGGFVKIYGSILRSSIWQQPLATKIVWITLLALADADGVVESSIPGLAATAGVSLEECERALTCFMNPDPYSGSKVDEGRRIRPCRGGWTVINHNYYRELRTERQVREAERIAAKRARAKACNSSVQQVADVRGVAADTDTDTDPPVSPLGSVEPGGSPAQTEALSPAFAGAASCASRSKRPWQTRRMAPEGPMPDDWAPTEAHRAYAAKHGLDVEIETDGFRGWAEGRTAVSWNGAFSTRLANAVKYLRERSGSAAPQRSASTAGRDEENWL